MKLNGVGGKEKNLLPGTQQISLLSALILICSLKISASEIDFTSEN